MSENFPLRDEFAAVADWSQSYLELQYSREVGTTFGELLRALADIATLPHDGIDRFEWLKQRELAVTGHLQQLALALADCQESRARLLQRSGALTAHPEQRVQLFVYGTLKRGGSRAAAMAGQRFVDVVHTAPHYRIFDCGGYPGLVEVISGLSIEGELWEVDANCLAQLDDIEGVALNLYERRPIQLAAPYGQTAVQSYFYQRSVLGRRDCGVRWPDRSPF